MISAKVKTTMDVSGLEKLVKVLQTEASKVTQVGWFDTGIHPDSLNHKPSTVAGVAWRNEFGIKESGDDMGVPERPFIRPTLYDTRSQQVASLKRAAVIMCKGGDPTSVRKRLGLMLKNGIKRTIDSRSFDGLQDNSHYIERRKGFNHPLKGKTGLMYSKIRHRLVPADF